MSHLLYLPHTQLHTHPRNMRRFYPADAVRQMADSLSANRGNLHAMMITPNGDGYQVVDGNLRLAAARLLGPNCPPLKCEVVQQSQTDQQLSMLISNTMRFDPDPVSEGLHYRALLAEGLSVADISRSTGVYETRIRTRMRLADLEEPLQQRVVEGRLSHDPRVVEALLAIPSPDARQKLVEKFVAAGRGKNIKPLVAAAQTLAEKLATRNLHPERRRLSTLTRSVSKGRGRALTVAAREAALPEPSAPAPLAAIREAARQSCAACDLKSSPGLKAVPEPAWSLVAHAADETCRNCNLADIESICNGCPLPDMLKRLITAQSSNPPILQSSNPPIL